MRPRTPITMMRGGLEGVLEGVSEGVLEEVLVIEEC